MIWTIIAVLFFGFGIFFLFMSRRTKENNPSEDLTIAGVWGLILGAIVLIILALNTGDEYKQQTIDIENVTAIDNLVGQRRILADSLASTFHEILIKTYPEHELAIFKHLTAIDVISYWPRYPELQALAGMQEYVYRIKELTESVYSQIETREKLLSNIRARVRDPWVIAWLIPKQ